MIGPPDFAISAATLPGIRVLVASVRGVQHRAEHTARQDAFALAQAGGTHAIAVVCDGVGSLDRSDPAAALVSQQLAGCGAASVPWPEAFATANAQLAKVAAEWEAKDLGAMATTALAVSVSPLDGWWLGEVAWVGDSPLWHLDGDGGWHRITADSPPEDGHEFHTSSVRPMPTPDGACNSDSFRVRGGALFAMSDGVGNPLAWSARYAPPWRGGGRDHRTRSLSRPRLPSPGNHTLTTGPRLGSGLMKVRGMRVSRDSLGPLKELAEGGFGQVYHAVNFRLGNDPSPIAFKEFTTQAAAQGRASEDAVSFRDLLSR